MGNLKDQALNQSSEDTQSFILNADEVGYLRLLNVALQYHTLSQKIMTGFLYYVATHRLGYKDGVNLQFKFDFADDSNSLEITLLPETLTQPPAPSPTAPPTPPAPASSDPATETGTPKA